ncbi:hypothetical protein [Lichenibacterium dinghuense]|uniref:hypothetical protein n=1 Tax=Lichenibacterium dinghuense TaxID=2895977 RepID=UPI001F414521|nr:hypothetical protein [Lichenibacterium sp. 6Y81]
MSLLFGLIGAAFGFILSTVFNVWKLRRDEFVARTDELCKAIVDASVQAVEYWSQDAVDIQKLRVAEAKLSAAQALVDGAYDTWKPRVWRADGPAVDGAMADLLDALTGGQFSEADRLASPEQVAKASRSAAACVASVRAAHRNTIPLGGLFDRVAANRNRELDMPIR